MAKNTKKIKGFKPETIKKNRSGPVNAHFLL